MKLILTACVIFAVVHGFEMPENYGEYFRQIEQNFYSNFQPTPEALAPESQPASLQKFSVFNHHKPSKRTAPFSELREFEAASEPKKKPSVASWVRRAAKIDDQVERSIPLDILEVRHQTSGAPTKRKSQRRLRRSHGPARPASRKAHHPWGAQHFYAEDGFVEPTQLQDDTLDDMEQFYENQAYETQRQAANDYTFDLRSMVLQDKLNQKMNELDQRPVFLEGCEEEEDAFDPTLASFDPENDGFKISKADFCGFLWNKYQYNCEAHQQFLDAGLDGGSPFSPDNGNYAELLRDVRNYQMMRNEAFIAQNEWTPQQQPFGPAMIPLGPIPGFPVPVAGPMVGPEEEEEEEGEFYEPEEDYEAEDDPDFDYYESYFPENHLKKLASDNYLDEINKVINQMAPKAAQQPRGSDFHELQPARPVAKVAQSTSQSVVTAVRTKTPKTALHRSSNSLADHSKIQFKETTKPVQTQAAGEEKQKASAVESTSPVESMAAASSSAAKVVFHKVANKDFSKLFGIKKTPKASEEPKKSTPKKAEVDLAAGPDSSLVKLKEVSALPEVNKSVVTPDELAQAPIEVGTEEAQGKQTAEGEDSENRIQFEQQVTDDPEPAGQKEEIKEAGESLASPEIIDELPKDEPLQIPEVGADKTDIEKLLETEAALTDNSDTQTPPEVKPEPETETTEIQPAEVEADEPSQEPVSEEKSTEEPEENTDAPPEKLGEGTDVASLTEEESPATGEEGVSSDDQADIATEAAIQDIMALDADKASDLLAIEETPAPAEPEEVQQPEEPTPTGDEGVPDEGPTPTEESGEAQGNPELSNEDKAGQLKFDI